MAQHRAKSLVLACEIYPPDIGGPATYAQMIVKSLKLKGYKVRLLTFGEIKTTRHSHENGSPEKKQTKTFNFFSFLFSGSLIVVRDDVERCHIVSRDNPIPIRLLFYFWKLWELARGVEVIYAMSPLASGLPAVIIGKLRKRRVVVRMAGDRAWETAQVRGSVEPFERFQSHRHGGWVGAVEMLERFVVKRADMVVVPSEFLKKIVVGWGAKEENVNVIPNAIGPHTPSRQVGTPLSRGDSPPAEGSPKAGVGERGDPVILAIGRLVPWKGFDDLITALPLVRGKVPHATLTIVGDGPEWESLHTLTKEMGVENIVKLAGRVPREELAHYWASAGVFALVSSYEGFPHLVLEAWAAGVPVVASAIPANRDIIVGGVTGLLVPYQDRDAIARALVRVLTNAQISRTLTENARKELKKYQWERIFEETEKLFFS